MKVNVPASIDGKKIDKMVGIGVSYPKGASKKEIDELLKETFKIEFTFSCGTYKYGIHELNDAIRKKKNIPCPCGDPAHMILEVVQE